MKNIEITSDLPVAVDRLWDEITKPALMVHIAKGMVDIAPYDPPAFPDSWQVGPYEVSLKLWGILPFGRQVIDIEYPVTTPPVRTLRDKGHSALTRVWDHLITLEPTPGGTRYTDRIAIDAGLLTPLVAAFAQRFYRHRQARLARLVAAGFDYAAE